MRSAAPAVIEFKLDGTILSANENFLKTMGYSEAEIVGRHHAMFAEHEFARSAAYRGLWERLNRGEFVADKFHRLGKGGKDVWIIASYNLLFDLNGRPYKVSNTPPTSRPCACSRRETRFWTMRRLPSCWAASPR